MDKNRLYFNISRSSWVSFIWTSIFVLLIGQVALANPQNQSKSASRREEGATVQENEGVNMEGGKAYQKTTVINFDDETIEGDLKIPDGQYLEVRKTARHASLIRIRTDFRREVLNSISDL